MRLGRLPALFLTMLVLAGTAAAQVSGKLVLGAYKPVAVAAKRPAYNWELENGFKEVKAEKIDARRELAVVLIGAGEPKGLERLEVTFAGGGLLPSTIVVRAGATMLIRNDDEIAHELFAPGLEGFSAEAISPHGRRSVSLQTAGAWPLRDKLITHVQGELYVIPDLVAVASVEADGQFVFKDVPPGKYTLKVFHGDKELAVQEVELGARPLSVSPITLTQSPAAK
jgi:hypothetical protein